MVTNYKMSENKMGYRGSKSILTRKIVKEQRVNDSWFLARKAKNLRCTLMGCINNYPVKILSKQLNIKILYNSYCYSNNASCY